MSNFKSQIKQDEYISKFIFNNCKNGFFVEIGALNGITLSNTYYFEKELGWKGICIEPNPKYRDDLSNNRICYKDYSPVYSSNDIDINFSITNLGGELSGITKHLDNIGEFKVDQIINIKTKTLTKILDEINAPTHIQYLSIDVEGAEIEVLKGINFDKYIFDYINIEHNYKPIRGDIHKFLYSKGYMFSRWNKFDDEFIHRNFFNKISFYDINQDKFDSFIK